MFPLPVAELSGIVRLEENSANAGDVFHTL
jgi:hypothetical protein